MLRIFGVKKKVKEEVKVEPVDAIMELKKTLETIDMREAHLNKQILSYKTKALTLKKEGNKKGALQQMKIMKQKEKQLDFVFNSKLKIDEQICALEQSINNRLIYEAMKTTKNSIKQTTEYLDVDNIEDTMDEIVEHQNDIEDISNILSKPLNNFDDDELLDELAELEEVSEEEDNDPTETELLILPDAPTGKIIIISEEEEELEKLEKEFCV